MRLLSAETSHNFSICLMSKGFYPRDTTRDSDALKVVMFGKEIKNPVGLAAGYDKNGKVPEALFEMGFGSVEVGSITPLPQVNIFYFTS